MDGREVEFWRWLLDMSEAAMFIGGQYFVKRARGRNQRLENGRNSGERVEDVNFRVAAWKKSVQNRKAC